MTVGIVALMLPSATVPATADAQVRYYVVLDGGTGMSAADLATVRGGLATELDANSQIDVAPIGQAPSVTDGIIASRHLVGLDISWTVAPARRRETIAFTATFRHRGSSRPTMLVQVLASADRARMPVTALAPFVASHVERSVVRLVVPRASGAAPPAKRTIVPAPPWIEPIPPAGGAPEFHMLEPRPPT